MEDMHLILRWHGEKDPISLRQYAQIPNLYGIVTSLYHLPLGQVGDRAEAGVLRQVCALMADQLAQSLHLKPMDEDHAGLYTNNGKSLPTEPEIKAITFSGGVADCVYQQAEGDLFRYGDIGVLLGEAIRLNPELQTLQLFRAAETIRATVVGAGEHTTEVSGSTIHYA